MSRKTLCAVLALVTALGALALAGCGSSDDNGSATTAPANTATGAGSSSGGTSAGKNAPIKVDMKDIQFQPKDVTVKVGQTIEWTNDDSVAHNVTAESGAKFASGEINVGGTYKYKATKPGKISYVCTIHPGMDGTITVTR